MDNVAFWITVSLAMIGHVALWTILFNRLHTLPWPRPRIKMLEKVIEVAVLGGLGGGMLWSLLARDSLLGGSTASLAAISYGAFCIVVLLRTIVLWWDVEHKRKHPSQLLSNHTEIIDVRTKTHRSLIGDGLTKWLARVPFNQIQWLAVQEKRIIIPNLPASLEGLKISHITDLHFTGQLTIDYFQYVVDRVNSQQPDLIAVTGDIVDKAHCIPWIAETLGRLESKYGAYFILGNHDKRVDEAELRGALTECGFIDVSSSPAQLSIGDTEVVLIGNELPWFPLGDTTIDADHFGILLSHSPDHLPWAKQKGISLMLAGHTHGGQISPPLIGPIVSPSAFGTRYACGLFYEAPTVMHVSRGLSGIHPIRINCPPELALLTLHAS